MQSFLGAMLLAGALAQASATGSHAQVNLLQVTDPEILQDHYRLAEALRQNNYVPEDVERGIALHQELAKADFAPSMRRLAIAHFYGEEAPLDVGYSAALLRKAVGLGDQDSRVWLGRVYMSLGDRPQEAHTLLANAAADGLPGASYQFAVGHVRRAFGDVSDPALGIEILTEVAESGDPKAIFDLASAYRQVGGALGNPEKARAMYQGLVDSGDPKAAEELGEMYRDGVGGNPDPEHAARLFTWAKNNGRAGARTKLTEVLLTLGRPEEARNVLVESIEAGQIDARLELALGDLGGTFGTASRPDEGRAALSEFAADPDPATALRVAQFVRIQTLPDGIDMSEIANILEASASTGDGRSTETLLRLLRERPEFIPNASERRVSLLSAYGETLRPKAFVEENVRMIGETTGNASGGPEALQILNNTDPESYRAGLIAAFQANRNMYVYVLQAEMAERGFYGGGIDGIARGQTMRAIASLCRAGGFTGTCSSGPLGLDATRAIAGYLSSLRAAEAS